MGFASQPAGSSTKAQNKTDLSIECLSVPNPTKFAKGTIALLFLFDSIQISHF